jgi:hypothetical protein
MAPDFLLFSLSLSPSQTIRRDNTVRVAEGVAGVPEYRCALTAPVE